MANTTSSRHCPNCIIFNQEKCSVCRRGHGPSLIEQLLAAPPASSASVAAAIRAAADAMYEADPIDSDDPSPEINPTMMWDSGQCREFLYEYAYRIERGEFDN